MPVHRASSCRAARYSEAECAKEGQAAAARQALAAREREWLQRAVGQRLHCLWHNRSPAHCSLFELMTRPSPRYEYIRSSPVGTCPSCLFEQVVQWCAFLYVVFVPVLECLRASRTSTVRLSARADGIGCFGSRHLNVAGL
jgi:hypothetical protein